MADDNKAGGDADKHINNDDAANKGADPAKKDVAASDFDPSKIGDEDFAKVFDDPRLFQHSRFKQLSERAKKAAELEKQQAEAEKAKLTEQQKWQELAEKEKSEKLELEQKYKTSLIDTKIQIEAARLGAVDAEAVAKLIDRSQIAIDESGTVTGVDAAIKSMQESKKYLFNPENAKTLGNATNPGADGNKTGRRFTLSQIQDPEFYRKNEQDILIAFKQGLITNDQ